ncbi:MAG: 4-alpha-glucanotransferase [Luteolibacter sp.]
MNRTVFNRRRAGLLIPVYALRHANDLGIGDTHAVKHAIDFCRDHGFSVLQMLPVQETIGDHSPYSPVSTRALSPALLSLTPEEVPGLTHELLEQIAPSTWTSELRKGNVNHAVVHSLKNKILSAAAERFFETATPGVLKEFEAFHTSQDWLESYTLYRTLIDHYDGNTQISSWQPEHHTFATAKAWLEQHDDASGFHQKRRTFAFIQWIAWRQWKAVREHADSQGVKLIGELTFGVSLTSCDVWAYPSHFDTDWHMGTRPLSHFDTNKDSEVWGQNWGLPAYRWENHRADGFSWLRGRVAWQKQFFHACRLDHLRGYFRAYMFPWPGGVKHVEFSALNEKEAQALTGGLLPRFVPGPDENPTTAAINHLQGNEIIGQLIEAAGDLDLVAEIMGEMPDYMADTLADLQLTNLAFPQLERLPDGNIRPPGDFRELSLVSYANHDNAPLAMLYLNLLEAAELDPQSIKASDLKALLAFAGCQPPHPADLTTELLQKFQSALFQASSRLAVLMCSDLIGIPLRFNLPGSYGDTTWSDRLPMSLEELKNHAIFGKRIANAAALLAETDRLPEGFS